MGHLGSLSPSHRTLLRRLQAGPVGLPEPRDEGARAGWHEILEILFTEHDAALAGRMPLVPWSLDALARRFGLPAAELKADFDRMASNGLVLDLVDPETGEATYQLAPSVVGFLEISVLSHAGATERRLAAAIDAYMHGDDTFARELSEAETVVGRALVHETTIDEDDLPEVLDWERATSLIDNARSIALLRCSCRQKAQYLEDPCDVPIERCIAIGAGADFVIRHGMGRGIEPAQAKDVLAASRADNLVQIADNVQQHPTFICNCCPCHCALLGDATKFGFAAVAPSAFVADPPLVGCRGCSRCSRSCPVGAITMASGSTGDERKSALVPVVDPDLCIGCGTCSDVCHRHAMHMSMKTARPQVPINAVERVVRMSLERGRLADLLFDASKNRSSRYLNGVVHAVCRLSPVDRLLATEQVRSRFVRYAMKNFEPPV